MNRTLTIFVVLFSLALLEGCSNVAPSCNGSAAIGGSGVPSLSFTSVPPRGSSNNLQGQAEHVAPSLFYVAVYIRVLGGWWTKPTFAQPNTTINCDGTWTTAIVTGGSDQNADAIAAFLLPQSYAAPLLSGDALLPPALSANAVANASVNR
jgi:hypothetical protein